MAGTDLVTQDQMSAALAELRTEIAGLRTRADDARATAKDATDLVVALNSGIEEWGTTGTRVMATQEARGYVLHLGWDINVDFVASGMFDQIHFKIEHGSANGQDGKPGYTITLPGKATWKGGTAPTVRTGVCSYRAQTFDGGTTWVVEQTATGLAA